MLIAGVIFLSCGCSRRAPEDDAGGRVSPLQEREVPDPFVDEIPPLPLAAPDPSATLSLERDTYEVALGSELAVCERLAWKHLEDVNGWTRTWSVTRWPDVGEELTAIIGKNVRTDTGLVVLDRESGDWVEMEGGGGSHFVIEPISHNAAGEAEHVRKYRLRFMRAGRYDIRVSWGGSTRDGKQFDRTEQIEVRVLEEKSKSLKPGT